MKYRLFHRSRAGIKAENAIPIAIIISSAPASKKSTIYIKSTPESATTLSVQVSNALLSQQYSTETANSAALFTEEIGLTILESNGQAKKPIMIELLLFFEDDHVLIIERDSGKLVDLTDPDAEVKGLSGFTLSGLMEAHTEKAYLVTTGYNRNMIRFYRA